MRRSTRIAVAVGGAFALTGGAVAYAAKALHSPAEEQRAVIADAANRLGVTPAKLTDAVTQALLDRVDAAVAAGTITADQAAKLKARIKSGGVRLFGGPMGGPGGGPGGPGDGDHRGGPRGGGLTAAAAKALGLTADALHQQLESGKSLGDLAKVQGKSVADLRTALTAAIQADVDAAVKDGRITADQAKAVVARETGELDALIARKGDGRGPGGPGGPGDGSGAPDQGFGSGGAALPTGPTGA